MDKNNMVPSIRLDLESDNFTNSWATIVGSDGDELDVNAFNFLLNETTGAEVVIDSSSDIGDTSSNQEMNAIDPDQMYFNPDLVALANLIKDEEGMEDNSVSVSTSVSARPASLPASQNWRGNFGFEMSFSEPDKKVKNIPWIFNADNQKLFVAKGIPCPINFSTSYEMAPGVKIRAMILYSSPGYASEVVDRCICHTNSDKVKNMLNAEHLIRCESPLAVYEVDPITKRRSVVIPFENPPPGQKFSSYIYRFMCFNSCLGGPSRRPLMLVFTLENDNEVIGRQKVGLKVCACPGRDSKTESKPEEGQTEKTKKRKKTSSNDPGTSRASSLTASPNSKRAKGTSSSEEEGSYTITVRDAKCYEFLKQMKEYFTIMKTIRSLPPDFRRLIDQDQQRKGIHFPLDFI